MLSLITSVRRRLMLFAVAVLAMVPMPFFVGIVQAQGIVLPSWNEGAAKQAIIDFVRATTNKSSPSYAQPEDRIATFDQDGTLWLEHPAYTQAMFALDRVRTLAPQHPEWKNKQPFKAVIAGDYSPMPCRASLFVLGSGSGIPGELSPGRIRNRHVRRQF